MFVPEMTVGEALASHPAARWVFAAYHIGGCSQCAMSEEETLAQLAEGYGLSLEKLIRDLNTLLAS
jgi:hybrid cluster-associated redox disulfide protein